MDTTSNRIILNFPDNIVINSLVREAARNRLGHHASGKIDSVDEGNLPFLMADEVPL